MAAHFPTATATATPLRKRGIYTLGNDNVLNDIMALVGSLNESNPNLDITVIAYNNNITETEAFCSNSGVSLIKNDLEIFDRIGSSFSEEHEKGRHIFRKFASFFGAYDDFIFIDADCLVLGNIDSHFSAFSSKNFDIAFYTGAGLNRNFNKEDIKELADRVFGLREGFNAAYFISKKGIFSLQTLEDYAKFMARLEFLYGIKHEQAFLNYIILTMAIRPLHLMKDERRISPAWDNTSKIISDDCGNYYYEGRARTPINALHYSSPHWRSGLNKPLYERFIERSRGLQPASQT
jgi:hypothetical protein